MLQMELSTAKRIPFTEEDERRIASAGLWGMIVAVTSIATGLISLVVQVPLLEVSMVRTVAIGSMVQAGVTVVINLWLLQACLAMRKVALTDEADQAHLLTAFQKLRAYFMVQVILLLVMILFGIVISVTGANF